MNVCFAVPLFGPGNSNSAYAEPQWGDCIIVNSSNQRTEISDFLLKEIGTLVNVPHNDEGFVIAGDGQMIYMSGPPLPTPAPLLIQGHMRVRSVNFKQRQRDGEIVLNPLVRYAIIATPKVSLSFLSSTPCPSWGGRNNFLYLQGRLPSAPLPCGNFSMFNGRPASGYQNYRRFHGEVQINDSPWNYVSASTIEAAFETYSPVLENPSLIQSTVAKLNERSVDFLTSVMEFPETIISIGEVLRNIKKLIQLFINRKSREELIRDRKLLFNEQSRLKTRDSLWKAALELNQATQYQRKKKHFLRRKIRRLSQHLRKIEREKRNIFTHFASTMSSLWLQLRYEVMPNIYLAQDLIKSAEQIVPVYQTERNFIVTDGHIPTIPGFEPSGKISVRHRFMGKYGYSPQLSDLYDLRKAFSTNPFLTAWELTKLSFVLDWFFSVGDMLSAKFGKPSLAVQQGFYLATKVEFDVTYKHAASKTSFTVTGKKYIGQVPYIQDFLGIFPLINLNWMRLVDSSALLWNELKRHFKLK